MGLLSSLLILFLFISNATAKVSATAYPEWHCITKCSLIGSSEKVYDDIAKDTFIGKKNFSCVNYDKEIVRTTADDYIIRLEGDLTTGFNHGDEISVNISSYLDDVPDNFVQSFPRLFIYADIPIGDQVAMHVLGFSDLDSTKKILLTINTPTHLANDVKAFVSKATLSIEREPEQLAQK